MRLLTPHFALEDLVRSEVATRFDIDNSLPAELLERAVAHCKVLEDIRAYLSKLAGRDIPMLVTSGYRCLALNRAIGSKDTSDHVQMFASDWRAPRFGSPYIVCQALAPMVTLLGVGQLINEYPDADGWVHTSHRLTQGSANRLITITHAGTVPGIVAA